MELVLCTPEKGFVQNPLFEKKRGPVKSPFISLAFGKSTQYHLTMLIALTDAERAALKKVQRAGGKGAAERRPLRRVAKAKKKISTTPSLTAKNRKRDETIRAEYATHTAPQLARKYSLSVHWIREIVSGRYGSPQRHRRIIARAIDRLKAAGYQVQPPVEMAS